MTPEQANAMPMAGGYLPADLWIELTGLINPVAPQGQAIVATVEDLQAETRLKLTRARQAVDVSTHLLAQDILTSTNWIEIRKRQDPGRKFGTAPSAALTALREVVPFQSTAGRAGRLDATMAAFEFLKRTPASTFYPAGPAQPSEGPLPVGGGS
jgi:histidine ammonia-lyase